jgi:hypothetical protein
MREITTISSCLRTGQNCRRRCKSWRELIKCYPILCRAIAKRCLPQQQLTRISRSALIQQPIMMFISHSALKQFVWHALQKTRNGPCRVQVQTQLIADHHQQYSKVLKKISSCHRISKMPQWQKLWSQRLAKSTLLSHTLLRQLGHSHNSMCMKQCERHLITTLNSRFLMEIFSKF